MEWLGWIWFISWEQKHATIFFLFYLSWEGCNFEHQPFYACLCNVKLVTSDLCCRKFFHIYVVVDMAPSQMWNSLYKDFRSWRWASWHTAMVYVSSPHWRQRHRYLVNVSRTDLMHLRFDFSEIFISCLSSVSVISLLEVCRIIQKYSVKLFSIGWLKDTDLYQDLS